MLYAFGSNGSCQLGVGHDDDLSSPHPILTNSSWQVSRLAAGGNHTLILCADGKVRAAGNNEDGRCGTSHAAQLCKFTEIDLPPAFEGKPTEIKQISATWSATFILCSNGRILTCGTGNSGELGLGPDVTTQPTLQTIPDFPPPGTTVIHLASSMAHTVAILSDGQVYGWGKGRKGQLGDPAANVNRPRKIAGVNFRAIYAACGKDFTLLTQDSSFGQVTVLGPKGPDRFGIRASAPEASSEWIELSASWGSCFALNRSGGVVAWGRNDHGQLPPLGLPKLVSIAAGSEHCLALACTGKVLAWGWGEHGNCLRPTDSRGDTKGRWNEVVLEKSITGVFAGCATSFIQTLE